MGRITAQTASNYRVQLRKLRRVLPLIPEGDPERARTLRLIEKFTNQLGLEMTDLEIALSRRPGRPRLNPNVAEYEIEPEINTVMTPEEIEAAKALRLAEFRARVLKENPDLAAEMERKRLALEESERALVEMQKLANEEVGDVKPVDESATDKG